MCGTLFPKVPSEAFGSPNNAAVPKSRGVQWLSDSSVARLVYTIFIESETSSTITVPSTKQGPCSDSTRSGPTPEAIFKTPRLLVGQRAREIGRKGKLCERWPLLTARPRRGRDVLVLAFAVQVRNRLGEAGCADPVSLSRITSRTAENASPGQFFSPLAWVVGAGTILPATNAPHWVQRAGFSQALVVRAQKVIFFMAGFCVNLA